MSKEIKDAAQQQAEESFDKFMYWMKKGTIVSCLILAIVVVGCNSGVEDDQYPASVSYTHLTLPTNREV